ncbi:efflux RND transporter periplasmic adaptor subunit [Aquitalea pelogenes]|uniref:efflux RND transporter periplasmic adaptor subunit n=1 Tax=Aquitalea pelogenes TaxID=1293573 RepID=UPI000786AB0C|nr:efflux RND transporter periplasmic adaptor subunit [Aquitalea pelogenes]
MNKQQCKLVALVVAVALASGGGGYWLARHGQTDHTANPAATAAGATKDGRKVLYWYDPMMPNQHFDKPGKSPFMDMQLVPKYADEGGETAGVRIDPGVVQNLGIRLATAKSRTLTEPIEAAASVMFNEREVAIVQARSTGFVQRVYARAPGDVVPAGAPIADLLVPEWAGAQQEYLAMLKTGDKALANAARERLRLTGMPESLIERVEQTGVPHSVVTISTPVGGVIQELDVRSGMTVGMGMTLAKINGLGTVWLEAAIPEAQAGRVRTGQPLAAQLTAYPGETFKGKVIAVLPQTNADSRTLRIRIELPNRDGRLKPGMFAQVRLETGTGKPAIMVPSEAIIRTGTRTVVLLAADGGHYQPVEVQIGQESGGKTVILKGLEAGQKVVASGQFLIDSEASLKGVLARLDGGAASTTTAPQLSRDKAATLSQAIGKVEAIQAGEITISHGPVATLGWGAMTMTFKLAKPELAAGLKPGDSVSFGFSQNGSDYVVQQLGKTGGGQ